MLISTPSYVVLIVFSLLFYELGNLLGDLIAAGLGYFGAYLERLLTCFSVSPLVPSRNWPRAFGLYICLCGLCVSFRFSVGLKCWTRVLDWSVELSFAVPHSIGLHGRLSWFMFWNCCTGQSFPKKLGAVRFAGYWRPASKSRRMKSRITTSYELGRRSRLPHTRLRRQKFGCPRVLEPAKNRSPLIPHRSPLREGSVLRYPRCWIDASYQFSLNQGLWSIPVCSIAEDNLVLNLDFIGLWPWLDKGIKALSFTPFL